jgi:hypothetical protein
MTAETSFCTASLAKVHKETEDFALNRITYDNEVLLIDSVKRTREFLKKVKRRFFLKKMACFLQSGI